MRTKILSFLLIFSFMFTPFSTSTVFAYSADNPEMNIYAMYLDSTEKGDSVLIESEGSYLLIDMGTSSHVDSIIQQLKQLGASHIDVLFSHLHKDHIGGATKNMLYGLKKLASSGIAVDTLYLPDQSLAPLSIDNPRRYKRISDYMNGCPGKIVYLTVGSHLTFGDVDGKVIGPLNTAQLSPSQYAVSPGSTLTASGNSIYTTYENNCSLAIIFTCGNTRYFTAGDCLLDESNYLLQTYGDLLDCDIMKLSHHGISAGNSDALLKAVHPKFTFASNSGRTKVNPQTGHWETYSSVNRAAQYGPCYLTANEKKTLIFHVSNDLITLYQGSTLTTGKKMTGWQYLYGADGTKRNHEMYYLDSDCTPYTGIHKLDGHYFNFDDSGRMEYGDFSSDGTYLKWKETPEGTKYFTLSSDKKYAYLSVGFQTINGIKYYFNKNGYAQKASMEEGYKLLNLGSATYILDETGAITTSDWVDINNAIYYFAADGKRISPGIHNIDGIYYAFDNNSSLITPEAAPCFYRFHGKTYCMFSDGELARNQCAKIGKYKYYFGQDGTVRKKYIVKMKGKKYYFGKSGKMICSLKFKYQGKTYKADKKGVLKEIKPKKKSSKK